MAIIEQDKKCISKPVNLMVYDNESDKIRHHRRNNDRIKPSLVASSMQKYKRSAYASVQRLKNYGPSDRTVSLTNSINYLGDERLNDKP